MDCTNKYDWTEMFQTMANKVAKCRSEELLYRQLKDFKDEFNSQYGKLSRMNRQKDGFSELQ